MKATLLMKPEGGREVKVEWESLQEVSKGNKGQLYASSYFTPATGELAGALLPGGFNTGIVFNYGFVPRRAIQKMRFNSR